MNTQHLHNKILFVTTLLLAGNGAAAEAPAAKKIFDNSGQVMSADFLLQFVLGLMLVVAAIFLLAWMTRRFGRFQALGNNPVRVITGMSVGSKERVVLVEVGDTQLLLGVAPGRVQTLHVLDHPVTEKKSELKTGENFSDRLSQLLKKDVEK